ncbi:hypothetical protein [Actinacidiphila soli]|uniref:hypothetical protein n=1 Tax=Actinacidiphila soli TaxID=2487275 RepID=UPI002AFEF311|nr:hypothetical protein [Actinacidiphila soli]
MVMGVTAVFGSGLTAAAHADGLATPAGIIFGVGATESQRVVSWYASTDTPQVVQVTPTSQLVKGEFPKHTVTFPATVAANSVIGDQALEALPVGGRGPGLTLVGVDHDDPIVGPAQRDCPAFEPVLTGGRLGVVDHLFQGRLPHV